MTATLRTWIDFGPGILVIGVSLFAAGLILAHRHDRKTAEARENLRRLPTRLRDVTDALDEAGDMADVIEFPFPVCPRDGGYGGEFTPGPGRAA